MKRLSKIMLMSLLAILIICAGTVSAFAADTLTVNGKEAPVGSTVTYTFNISDAQQKIAGIHMVLFFDQKYLSLESVDADNLSGSTINDNQNGDGQIVIVNGLVNGASGLKCEEKTDLVTVTFKVLGGGTTEVAYYIPYLYDFDMVNIYDYTLTCDLGVDGEIVAADETPILQDVSTLDGFDAGDFDNNEEGTGSGIKPVVTEAQANNEQNNKTEGNGTFTNPSVIFGIVCACVLVGAIVVLTVVKVVSAKKNPKDDTDVNI